MLKQTLLTLISILLATGMYAQTITLDGTVYNVDTLENHQVGPATQYQKLRLTGPGTKRLDVYFLIADVPTPILPYARPSVATPSMAVNPLPLRPNGSRPKAHSISPEPTATSTIRAQPTTVIRYPGI
jgi:hypothetical protein